MIAVGRRIGTTDPYLDNFTNVLCLTKSSPYGSLSPYTLTNKIIIDNNIVDANLENIWQFSKIYENVKESIQRKSRFDNKIIWNHPSEIHIKDGIIQKSYWEWRKKGFLSEEPIRYPVGFNDRKKCLCSIYCNDNQIDFLNYIDARKKIYLPNYLNAINNLPVDSVGYKQLNDLKEKLKNGTNILIIEVDGPHYESINYYKQKYLVNDNFILPNNTTIIDEEKLKIFLNDEMYPFGHGYCLAWKLLSN